MIAFEVKLSTTVDDEDVRHLRWLHGQLGDELLDAAMITTGQGGIPSHRRYRSHSGRLSWRRSVELLITFDF